MNLLMLAATVLLLQTSCGKEEQHRPSVPVKGDEVSEAELKYHQATKQGTMIRSSAADPSIVYSQGQFYLTMTGSSKIALVYDEDLANLTTSAHSTTANIVYNSAVDKTVSEIWGSGATINGTWSPELHYFSEDDCADCPGWYMVLGLRLKNNAGDSSDIVPVVLKSLGKTPAGPWGNPITGASGVSQRFLDSAGKAFDDWVVGVSFLRIPSGKYKGIYATWVDEVGRGEGYGKFYQRLRIARMKTPWQIDSEASTITYPTQDWEKKGASSILPMVVEGGTAIYGNNGEIFMAYCGSGYWSDYGLGQLTLKMENGDYADPLKTESWIKYAGNPVFTSSTSSDLRGAGHAFFFEDAKGNRLMCYHAYPYVNGVKADGRNAYVEPYSIDYASVSETAPLGVLKFGLLGQSRTAPVTSGFQYYYATVK